MQNFPDEFVNYPENGLFSHCCYGVWHSAVLVVSVRGVDVWTLLVTV